MRLIHFFTDEKFTDFVIYLFDQFKDIDQKYILVKSNNDQKVNFKYEKIEHILLEDVNKYVADFKADCVIFHSLFNFNLKVLNELQTNAKVCWYSWGGDLALEPLTPFKSVHEPVTLSLYHKNNFFKEFKNSFWNFFKLYLPDFFNWYYKKRTGDYWGYYLLKKNLHKISIANTVTFSEHDILRKNNYKGEFIHIPIGTIGLLLEGVDINKQSGENKEKYPTVFLGHSAYSENNQFDVLKALKENNFQGKIICPVNYGSKEYAKKLMAYGKLLFSDKFICIDTFLEQSKYFQLMQEADYYLNNSIIQQGLGNIIAALYLGKSVFIHEKGKANEYLSQMGIKTFSIQKDLNKCNDYFYKKDDLKAIRQSIDNIYLEQNVIKKLNVFLSGITK